MPKNSRTIHTEFLRKLRALNSTRVNFEAAFGSTIVTAVDINQAYAGLYLDLFTEFENLIENLFLGLLSGGVSHHNGAVVRRVLIKPVAEVEAVLLGEKKNYLDWIPYKDHTIPRAKLHLIDGKPFTSLSDVQKGKIASYHKIRNAIAHKSKKAMREFNAILSASILLPIERTPQGYLRHVPNRATGKTQLENISDELSAIAHVLCY